MSYFTSEDMIFEGNIDYKKMNADDVKKAYSKKLERKLKDMNYQMPRNCIEAFIETKTPEEKKLWLELEEFGIEVLDLASTSNGSYDIKFYTHIMLHEGIMDKEEIYNTARGDLSENYTKHEIKAEEIVSVIKRINGKMKFITCLLQAVDDTNKKQFRMVVDENGKVGVDPSHFLQFKDFLVKMFNESGYIIIGNKTRQSMMIRDEMGEEKFEPIQEVIGIEISNAEWFPLPKQVLKDRFPSKSPEFVFKKLVKNGDNYHVE